MKIYWDYENHELLSSIQNIMQFQRLDYVLRDQVAIELYLVTKSEITGTYTIGEAPSGYAVKCSIKPSDDRDSDPLASQYVWTLSGTGESAKYSATLDLNKTELIAAVEAETNPYLDLVIEFVLQNASAENRDSTQADLRVTQDIHRPSDSAATSANLLFPWFEFFDDETTGEECLRIKNTDGQTLAIFKPAGV